MSPGRTQTAKTSSTVGIELLDRVDYRLAETAAEKETIYRLRYRAYLKEGAVQPSRDRIVTDRFDDLDNSWTFGVYLDGVLSSSLRISVASRANPVTPSMDVFQDVLEPAIGAGKVLVDPTRFVADPERAERCPELPYVTLRLAYVACGYFNADIGLATVRAEHQAFYRRLFMHKSICPPRNYPGLLKPIALMAVDYQAKRDVVFDRYPFLRSTFFERRMLFERSTARHLPGLPARGFAFEAASIAP